MKKAHIEKRTTNSRTVTYTKYPKQKINKALFSLKTNVAIWNWSVPNVFCWHILCDASRKLTDVNVWLCAHILAVFDVTYRYA